MAQSYEVQVGDSISAIAKRFGVPVNAVTGFRSNDANVIFPGEKLTINTPAPVAPQIRPGVSSPEAIATAPNATSVQTGQPVFIPPGAGGVPNATDAATGQPVYKAPIAPVAAPAAPIAPEAPVPAPVAPVTAPVAPPAPVSAPSAPLVAPTAPTEPTTPPAEPNQGIDAFLQELATARPDLADEVMSALGYANAPSTNLTAYGIDPGQVEKGFQVNPTQTLQALVKQVMDVVGMPDVRQNITDISKQMEDLANERDDKIRAINDDPFKSAGTKQQEIGIINDKYELRIKNRQDRLTLLQNAYTQARQEAQFAVTTAVNYYDKERSFNLDQLKTYFDQVEKAQSAQKNLGFELSPGQVRYQLDPTTGEYKAVASLPGTSTDLGGLSKEARTYLNQIQDNARQDPNIKEFPAVRASFETARSAALKQSGAGDIVLMRMIAKITDPTTGVREEEFRTFEGAQSTLSQYGITLTKRMWAGDRLTNEGRLSLYQQAKDIYEQRLSAYENSVDFFDKQATNGGLPSGLVMPTYTAPQSTTSNTSGGWF